MSNLSELLPTGGGQNAVDFVASGTLSSGQTVALKADGTVEAITGKVSTAVNFENANSSYIGAAFDSISNKVVIAYQVGATGKCVIGTVSGSSISFGTSVTFSAAVETYYNSVVFDAANNKVVIAYAAASFYGTAIVGTVSGTSISFGTAVVFESAATEFISATFDSNSNKVVIAYRDSPNADRGTAIVGTVSGTSISFGSAVVFNSATTDWVSATFDSNSNKVVIAYRDVGVGSPFPGTAIVGTVSGTSISFGSEVVFNSAQVRHVSTVFDTNSNKVVIAYRNEGNSSYGTAIVGTVSGTSISFGSATVFEAAASLYIGGAFDSTNNKVIIAYDDGGNSSYGTAIVGTVSGTSISFASPEVFEAGTTRYIVPVFDSNSNKVAIPYADASDLGYGKSVVFDFLGVEAADFIGITAEAISDTATGPVNVYGGINEAQTGLTIGSDYYVQNDGSLSTTASSVKVGQAISATTINMMDLT